MKDIGGIVGTVISASYLFLLALFNLSILIAVYRTFRAVRRGEALRQYDLDLLLNGRGLVARLFRPLFRIATRSWHMFPMGLLFGLAAVQASKDAPFSTIMVFRPCSRPACRWSTLPTAR